MYPGEYFLIVYLSNLLIFERHLMKVSPEMRRAHLIRYLRFYVFP
jgi:hypothetical protein